MIFQKVEDNRPVVIKFGDMIYNWTKKFVYHLAYPFFLVIHATGQAIKDSWEDSK